MGQWQLCIQEEPTPQNQGGKWLPHDMMRRETTLDRQMREDYATGAEPQERKMLKICSVYIYITSTLGLSGPMPLHKQREEHGQLEPLAEAYACSKW